MQLADLITENKAAVVDRWYEYLLSSYPPETVEIWKRQKDRFKNPVGAAFTHALDALTDEIVRWRDAETLCARLDEIIRIRSVQEIPPSKALAFVYQFKKVLREVLGRQIAELGLSEDAAMFDSRVDNLALMALDVYVAKRDQVFEMRVREFKDAHYRVFQKAGIMCGSPREVLGLEDHRNHRNGK